MFNHEQRLAMIKGHLWFYNQSYMARYTCSFTVSTPVDNIQSSLIDVLRSCRFEIIYDTGDYLMAREVPGQVAFGKLVTVEVLIDKPIFSGHEIRMNFVIKNEELPLQVDNHCWQMYNSVRGAVTDNQQWQLLEAIPS